MTTAGGAPLTTARAAGATRLAGELDYEATIIEGAETCGWMVHGERPARSNKGWRTPIKGRAGWPDLVLVHPVGGILYVELKADGAKLRPDQGAWAVALTEAGANYRTLHVPSGLHEFLAELAERAMRGRRR